MTQEGQEAVSESADDSGWKGILIPGLPPPPFSPIGRDGMPTDVVDIPYYFLGGGFPMGEPDDPYGRVDWHIPGIRALFPGCRMRLSRSLRRTVRRERYRVTFDEAFEETVAGCADREETWITAPLIRAYSELHAMGLAHSAEAWLDGELVGGVFGISFGRVFVGESMFHRARDASKVALAHLSARLVRSGFAIHDAQILTPHVISLGAAWMPQSLFVPYLTREAEKPATFDPFPSMTVQEVLQWSAQTS